MANEFTDRAFAVWVPVAQGDRIAVLGDHPTLCASLRRAGASVYVPSPRHAADDGLPPHIDHLVVLDVCAVPDAALQAAARLVGLGGTILVGAAHRRRFPWRRDARNAAQMIDELRRWGAADADVYLVRQSITNPRAVVPLDDGAVRWYLEASYVPLSRPAAVVAAVLGRLRPSRTALSLFPSIVAVGCKTMP